MTLILNNDVVAEVLTMPMTLEALEASYRQLVTKEAVCRPRVDIRIPTSDPAKTYQWGTMEGGSQSGYFAIRMKSDVTYVTDYEGVRTKEKYCSRPGLFCGLILLTSTETGEPLALINDGVLQHMRVAADGGIGAKFMAREDAETVGMLGSGGMARTHMAAFTAVRNIKKLQVFSPTKDHREAFAAEMADLYGIETVVCDRPEDIYKGADIVAAVTDSTTPVLDGNLVEPGTHITNVGTRADDATRDRIDIYLRFGNAPAPWGHPGMEIDDEYLVYAAMTDEDAAAYRKRMAMEERAHGVIAPDRVIWFADIVGGTNRGRTDAAQITYSERGNLQGAQFWAVAAKAYEAAKAEGLGHEIPTEWLLQDIRD